VQITYLGYPDTTGVPAMDYRFTDPIADPPGDADAFATEKLVRFSSVAWSYLPPQDAPDVAPPPCLKNGYVTFGCFNSPTKFTDSLYRAWAQILVRVPNSRLLLKGRDFETPDIRELLLGRMQRSGVPTDRVDLIPRTESTAEHLAQYSRVDVALDTFPYNGTTTTCEAIWMGRPVITLCGARHAARVGSSLLTQLGRNEWVAQSVSRYVDLAVTLAAVPDTIRAASSDLRSCVARSPLLNHAEQGRRFAEALRNCWRERTTDARAATSQVA
jgi:predicted O-linked N-acetylglucosamine transferase (SPINDLY family)